MDVMINFYMGLTLVEIVWYNSRVTVSNIFPARAAQYEVKMDIQNLLGVSAQTGDIIVIAGIAAVAAVVVGIVFLKLRPRR